MRPIITLTTDFGTKDAYVAAMKGVIKHINPTIDIIDLTHEISPQNIYETGLFLLNACCYYPAGTIHVVVVDPGVGTERKPVIIRTHDHYFVCPDNGLLTHYMEKYGFQQGCIISNPAYIRPTPSATFHGRDIFAPAAAHLASGISLDAFGEPLTQPVTIDIKKPTVTDNTITGEIVHIDHFGNLISNIPQTLINRDTSISLYIQKKILTGLHKTYGATDKDDLLALIGSSGYVEISINHGNAKNALNANIGLPLIITMK